MNGRTWALALLLPLLPLFAAPALAQPAEPEGAGSAAVESAPDEALSEEARVRFEAGRNAYRDGRFDEALVNFERVYEITEEPDLLYNIAAVHDRLRRDEEALAGYRRYLELRPASPDRSHIEARVSHLQRALDAAAVREEPSEPSGIRAEDDIRLLDDAGLNDPAPPAGFGELPAVLGIVGGGLLVGSVSLWAWFFVDRDSITNVAQGTPASEISGAYGRAPVVSGFAIALLGLGAAALTAGIVLAVIDAGQAEPAVALRLGPGALSVEGRF